MNARRWLAITDIDRLYLVAVVETSATQRRCVDDPRSLVLAVTLQRAKEPLVTAGTGLGTEVWAFSNLVGQMKPRSLSRGIQNRATAATKIVRTWKIRNPDDPIHSVFRCQVREISLPKLSRPTTGRRKLRGTTADPCLLHFVPVTPCPVVSSQGLHHRYLARNPYVSARSAPCRGSLKQHNAQSSTTTGWSVINLVLSRRV